jgi:hypothetical protein
VPVLFVVSGMQFDLPGLFTTLTGLLRVLLCLVLFLIVVITTIGVAEGRMRPVNAAALAAVGLLSVPLYLRPTSETYPTEADLEMSAAATLANDGVLSGLPGRSASARGWPRGWNHVWRASRRGPLVHRHRVGAET